MTDHITYDMVQLKKTQNGGAMKTYWKYLRAVNKDEVHAVN